MFKLGSFEKELFEGMKKNLEKNASEQSLEVQKTNLKIAQSLNLLKDMLSNNKLDKQSNIIEKFLNKKASKIDVIKSFDDEFNSKINDSLAKEITKMLVKANFGNDAIKKMVKEKENKYDNLFSKSSSKNVSYIGHQSVDLFNKNFVKDIQVLDKLSKLIDPLEKEINNETVLDENSSDDTFED